MSSLPFEPAICCFAARHLVGCGAVLLLLLLWLVARLSRRRRHGHRHRRIGNDPDGDHSNGADGGFAGTLELFAPGKAAG